MILIHDTRHPSPSIPFPLPRFTAAARSFAVGVDFLFSLPLSLLSFFPPNFYLLHRRSSKIPALQTGHSTRRLQQKPCPQHPIHILLVHMSCRNHTDFFSRTPRQQTDRSITTTVLLLPGQYHRLLRSPTSQTIHHRDQHTLHDPT